MKFLAFLATKKGLVLLGVGAFLLLKGRARAAAPPAEVRGENGQLLVRVSEYYDELVGGKRFCYEEGIDENDQYFRQAVSCEEADQFGTVGAYKVRSG